MVAIQTRQLTLDYGNGKGIFDLDIIIKQGRVHGFLGPNGAGKTTMIRLLLGFLRPTSGAIRVLGQDPTCQMPNIWREVGYVPGELAFPERLTGRQFLRHSAVLRGGIDEAYQRRLSKILAADLDQKIGTLSKGNRQKVALIDALQHKPRLLILDEPTDGLDPLLRFKVASLLRRHARQGGTVFLSSHVVHEIQTMCDDVSIVIGGRLHKQENIAKLVAAQGTIISADFPDPKATANYLQKLHPRKITVDGSRLTIQIHGNPLPLLALLSRLPATNVNIHQGDLEEFFLDLYRRHA